jgi:hypothetical protein
LRESACGCSPVLFLDEARVPFGWMVSLNPDGILDISL